MDIYTGPLREYMSKSFDASRTRLGLSQAKMAERLGIESRSYFDLEKGNRLCCTRVFIFYMLRCDIDREKLLTDLDKLILALEDEM